MEALAADLRAGGGEAWAVTADLATDEGAARFAQEAWERLGGVDRALLCAGAAHPATPLQEASRALLLEQLEQNVVAALLPAGALLRERDRRGAAGELRLLFLSSLATRRPPMEGAGPYTAAKAALDQAVRSLAEEAWGRALVNGLNLGPVATRLHARAGTPAEWVARFPSTEEAAPLVVRLLGPEGDGLTGRCVDAEALALDGPAALRGTGALAFVDPLQAHLDGDDGPAPEAEPGRRPSPRVRAAVRAAAPDLNRHPRETGRLIARLAALHDVDPDCVVLSGGGATGLLERCLRALAGPGDEVVSPFPTYEVLSVLCARLGLRHRPAPSPRLPDGLFGPLAARPLLAALGPRSRAVYVASPDNPTGASLPAGELDALLRGLPAPAVLLLDEAWSLEPPAPLDPPPGAHLVRLRTFSKLFGLAGLRLGWAVAPPPLASLLRRLELPFPVGTPQLAAALAALDELPRAGRAALLLRRQRARLGEELRALGLRVSAGESPVLLVRDPRRGASAGPLLFALRAAGVPVQEAHWDPAAVAVSVGTRAQDRRLVAALRRALGHDSDRL